MTPPAVRAWRRGDELLGVLLTAATSLLAGTQSAVR